MGEHISIRVASRLSAVLCDICSCKNIPAAVYDIASDNSLCEGILSLIVGTVHNALRSDHGKVYNIGDQRDKKDDKEIRYPSELFVSCAFSVLGLLRTSALFSPCSFCSSFSAHLSTLFLFFFQSVLPHLPG